MKSVLAISINDCTVDIIIINIALTKHFFFIVKKKKKTNQQLKAGHLITIYLPSGVCYLYNP